MGSRIIGALVVGAASCCRAPAASAAPLWVDGEPTSLGGCNLVSAEVVRWTPSQGPPAAFVARRFVENGGKNSLITLGADAAGFWTAELRAPSDACDDCDVLELVHTGFDGKRRRYPVADATKLNELELSPEQRFARTKQALFALAAGPWHTQHLSQRYRLALPRHDSEGRLQHYAGWFADVRFADQPALRFGVRVESVMCWCNPRWLSYALRA